MKSLYGLPSAPKLWSAHFAERLEALKWRRSNDSGLFMKEVNGKRVYLRPMRGFAYYICSLSHLGFPVYFSRVFSDISKDSFRFASRKLTQNL